MPKYMFVYRSENEAREMSPEQMQETMQRWMSWIQDGAAAGWIVDPGDALLPDGRVVQKSGVITDGPFAESKELVGGYTLVQADSIEQACERTQGCPIFAGGGSVEVRQLAEVAGDN